MKTLFRTLIFVAAIFSLGRFDAGYAASNTEVYTVVNSQTYGSNPAATDNTAAFTAAYNAVIATAKFGYVFIPCTGTYNFTGTAGITWDVSKVGMMSCGATLNFTSLATNASAIKVIGTNWYGDNSYLNTRTSFEGISLLGNSASGTIGFNLTTSSYDAAHYAIRDVSISGFGYGVEASSNSYLVHFEHDNIFGNGVGFYAPSGCANCGENFTFVDTSFFNNSSWALDLENPDGDYNFITGSIDYNITGGASSSCQVKVVDSHVTISDSHIEDFTHVVDCVTSSTSAPLLNLLGDTFVRATPTATHLIDAGSGGYTVVFGGAILATGSPQTLVGPSSGGIMFVQGLQLGTAAFSIGAGAQSATLCDVITTCIQGQNNVFQGSMALTTFFECEPSPITLTVAGSWTAFGSSAPSVVEFRDKTSNGFATFAFDPAGAVLQSASNTITDFQAQWASSQPQIRITGGTDPRSITYCQRLLQ